MKLTVLNWKNMLRNMYSGQSFDLVVRSWNKAAEIGGKRKEYKGCFLQFNGKAIGNDEAPKRMHHIPTGNSKKPNHKMNGTLNIILKNGDVNSIHLPLIEFFNGLKVIP